MNKCNNCEDKIYANNICKKCYMAEYNKKYYNKNKEKIKQQNMEYYIKFIDENRLKRKEYARNNKRKDYYKNYYNDNKKELRLKQLKNYIKNKERYLKIQYNYKQNRLKTDIIYYIKDRLSTRIRMAIMNHKGIKKTNSIELLGANIHIVRKHIEEQFIEGMNWNNHGEWHIDHIIPCASFDLTKKEEQMKCFHYTNLQPLWSKENIIKADKILNDIKW